MFSYPHTAQVTYGTVFDADIHHEMPKAPTNTTKPQAAVPGRKPTKKGKKNVTKKAVIAPGKPRVQVSFDSKDSDKTNGTSLKGKGRADSEEDDDEMLGDDDITMTGEVKHDDDEEDQKPDISKLNGSGSGAKKRVATQNEKFLVIAGSYEKNMYGLEIDVKDYKSSSPETSPPIVKPIFIFPAHLSCIKTMKASPGGGKFLATGSDDEFVKVWDLRRRKEIGSLSQHIGKAFPFCTSSSLNNRLILPLLKVPSLLSHSLPVHIYFPPPKMLLSPSSELGIGHYCGR